MLYPAVDEKKGIVVVKKDNEDIESLVRRFRKKVMRSGILRESKLKDYYEKPSRQKKRKRKESESRRKKEEMKLKEKGKNNLNEKNYRNQ